MHHRQRPAERHGERHDVISQELRSRPLHPPVRLRLHKPKELAYQGSIAPGQTKYGSKVKYIYFNSCWVGHMKIGNTQYTTGELRTR